MGFFYKKNRSGFTLIELMIVVVIIGVLSALSMSMYRTAARKARYAGAKIWLKRIYQACEEFYYDCGCYPPDVNPGICPPGLCPGYLEQWPKASRDAFGANYDYESHNAAAGMCVGVTYLGKDKQHELQWVWGFNHGTIGQILEIPSGDDLFIVIAQGIQTCQ